MSSPKISRVGSCSAVAVQTSKPKTVIAWLASWMQLDGLSVYLPTRVPHPSLDIWPLSFICQLSIQAHVGSCLSLSISSGCDCDSVVGCSNPTDFRKWLTAPFFTCSLWTPVPSHHSPNGNSAFIVLLWWCNDPLLF